MTRIDLNVDTEYQPVRDCITQALTIQLQGNELPEKLYLHPKAPIVVDHRKHDTFQSPFVPIDYFGWKYRDVTEGSTKYYITLDAHVFFSYKDLEFMFAESEDYRKLVLPNISRTRRISSVRPIGLPWEVYVPDKSGKYRWHRLSLNIIDICAMQGAAGLKTYADNVGVRMETKGHYTQKQKSKMLEQYLNDPIYFQAYASGDLKLKEIKELTIALYNKIADILGLEPRKTWGMSTGKIVASIVTDWISKRIGVDVDSFYLLTSLAGSKGVTDLSRFFKNKSIVYTAMVDGGRAVKERDVKPTVDGMLVDIDISGCYGNGLKNQKFAVGNPTLVDQPMSLRKFLCKYNSQLLPGLWVARVSWKDAPFKQDLLISKVEGAFTNWDLGIQSMEKHDFSTESKNVYDASMVLTTNSVSNAALTHDALQVFKYYAAPSEWKWIQDNAVVESALIYRKRHRVKKVTPKMLEGVRSSEAKDTALKATKDWVEVNLDDLMSVLIAERKKAQQEHGKGSPMDVFLKLIINTIYGTIASEYFSEKGTGVSNVVVGNNITARARSLAWLMAKGLHSHCSITDGGVFDINNVLKFDKMSLGLLEGLHRDVLTDPHKGNFFAAQVPLMGHEVTAGDMPEVMKEVDSAAWQHLKATFPKLDIFSEDQFSFESKDWYVKLTMHSKVDYRLTKSDGKSKIALRGMPKVWSETAQKKITDPRADELFDAIERGKEPLKLVIEDSQLLSQADWEKHPKKSELLPHDEVSDIKTFYSHTPLAARYTDIGQYKRLNRAYEAAKKIGTAEAVAEVYQVIFQNN